MDAPALIGLDLAGPTNAADTALAAFALDDGAPRAIEVLSGLDDRDLAARIAAWAPDVVVALDAPLSYQPGGGDRAADRALRQRIRAFGTTVSVMTPTMTRMAYLTLRGLAVARLITTLRPQARIVETHPAAHLLLAGAPPHDVVALKSDAAARSRLVQWMSERGMGSVPEVDGDHEVAAIAAARAAWAWAQGNAHWETPGDGVLHPFPLTA